MKFYIIVHLCRLWDLEHSDNYVLNLEGHCSYDSNESLFCVGFCEEKGNLLFANSLLFLSDIYCLILLYTYILLLCNIIIYYLAEKKERNGTI